MIKLGLNPHLISKNDATSPDKKSIENLPQNIFSPISIHNINTTLSKESRAHTHSTALEHKIQCVKNRLSAAPTLNEKLHLYKTYSHYGHTPKNSHADLDTLEAVLLHTNIQNTRHVNLLRKQLPALKLMAETLLTSDSRKTLTPPQLTEINQQENVIRNLITAAASLPNILFNIDHNRRAKHALSVRNALIDELIQGALRRLTGTSPSSETELRALLHAPSLSLHEKLERFIANNQKKLLKPLYNELRTHLQIIKQTAASARRFLNNRPFIDSSLLSPPVPTDTLYAIRTVAEYLETLARQLKSCLLSDSENEQTHKKYTSWLSSRGMEPAVPAANLVHALHCGLNNSASALEKRHKHINHEHPFLFPVTELKPFLSLSLDERMQCIMLKKMVIPMQDNAHKLQLASTHLRKAIEAALQENGQPLLPIATPEAALHIELAALMEETPHIKLLLAAEAAHTTAQQILNTTTPCPAHTSAYAKILMVIQEYSHVLIRGAHHLKQASRLAEIDFRQKSILSAIHDAEKTAHDIKHILRNALESISGVALNSRFQWLRKLDIDLHAHWQEITTLANKGCNPYILCGQGLLGLTPPALIQYAVLPLLNETEKLRGACLALEMILASPANQDAIEKTTDKIRNITFTDIALSEKTIQEILSGKNNVIYLCYKHTDPSPVSLTDILQTAIQSLVSTGQKLKETAWLLSWNAEDTAVRQSLSHIKNSLRSIKKKIKDTVETATGVRPHINSPEGMIAKDAAEWLMKLKEHQNGKSRENIITALIDCLCKEFTTQHDPEGALFRLRITLAIRDAEQGTLIWPLSPREHLNIVKTPRDYTLAWAEKRLTYSMLYNCLIYHTPAALFSLSSVKNTLVSPLRLINLLLTPVRMAVTRRAMQKVRPGSTVPTDLIAEYTTREMYQAVFRIVSLLSPQLFKTAAATSITTYGLAQGGKYRHAFLTRAVSRLPGDLFWVGGFAAWHQAVSAFHALQQQDRLSSEHVKLLQKMLNLNPTHEKNTEMLQQAHSLHTRHIESKNNIELDPSPENELSVNQNVPTQLDKNLEFIQSYYHNKALRKPHYKDETSLDWWWQETEGKTFWKEVNTNNPAKMIIKNNLGHEINVIHINNRWYLNDWEQQKAYLHANLKGLDTLPTEGQNILEEIFYTIFKTHPETSLNDAVKIANSTLSILMFQNLQNRLYTLDILQIKYSLMFSIPNTTEAFLDLEQIDILMKLKTPVDWDTIKDNLASLYPTQINTQKYDAAYTQYHKNLSTPSLNRNDPYYTGIAACEQFLLVNPINEKNNRFIFNKARFHFTKKQAMILHNATLTQKEKDELIWLNIAKHHLYVLFKIPNFNIEPQFYAFKDLNKENPLLPLPLPLIKEDDAKITYTLHSENNVTPRLLEVSGHWKDSSAIQWQGDTKGIEGGIYSTPDKKYIYLRGMLWEIFQTAENHIFILAKTQDSNNFSLEARCHNKTWDIVPPDTRPTSDPSDLNLESIKFYLHQNKLHKHMIEITSLHWWLYNKWKDTQENISRKSILNEYNTIITIGDKKYLHIYPYFWEYNEEEGNPAKGTLRNRLGEKLEICLNINDGQWYLNDWAQQKIYLNSTVTGLNALPEQHQQILDSILEKIFKTSPETPPEHAIKIANTALSMRLFQHIHDKLHVNDILQIKYFLMSIRPDDTELFIDAEQIDILHKLNIPIDLDALKKNMSQLYPTEIDHEQYITALKTYYLTSPETSSPPPDNNDLYYKGIAYCHNLIKKFKNENNQLTFNQVLFHLTKKELTLPITEEQSSELVWLNITKYHLYATSQYLSLQKSIAEQFDNILSSHHNNIFTLLKESKLNAIKIYYFNQENLDASHITLSEKEILCEYSSIIALKNEDSHCLEMITAALFYQAHTQEKWSGFDFIKAKIYYEQQIEQLVKEVYTFDAVPPDGIIFYKDFKPSQNFSTRKEYTNQFNNYVDNGSSSYEAKLLTPLLLSQFDISLEDLTLPPKRWFTLKLYCYDYPHNHLGWSIHNTHMWPEKINIIQLHNGDYLTISEINGNMKINLIPETVYTFYLEQNTKKNTYFYAKSDNVFLNILIGSIPPPTIHDAFRNCELKFYEEKRVPVLVKTAVQQAIHASLNALAGYQKDDLESVPLNRKILEIFVPFYKEMYHAWTDSKYTMDKTSLLIDCLFVAPFLQDIGVSLKSLEKEESVGVINTLIQGTDKGLNWAELAEFISRKIPKSYISQQFSQIGNELIQLIETLSIQALTLEIIRKENRIVEIPETQAKFPVTAKIKYPVPLKEQGKFGRYKGIYAINSTQTDDPTRYFIKNGEEIYQVRWDKNKYTWRLVESGRPMGRLYGMPVQYFSPNEWVYHPTLRLRGGGKETQEIITETEELVSEFNARNPAKIGTVRNIDLFASEKILKDSVAIHDLTQATQIAQRTAIDMLTNARNILHDRLYASRSKELIRIFTNRQNTQDFLVIVKALKKALKNLNVKNDIKLVDIEDSTSFAQISPYRHVAKEDKYLSINYSCYQKNKELIFSQEVPKEQKEYYANENFARTLIHEFTHANSVISSTDAAGYIELLHLNGRHNVTKLLIQAKLNLPEVRNNADSLTEIIYILAETENSESYLDSFLENYQKWEIELEKRIQTLQEQIKSTVADKTQLSWTTTVKSEIIQLKEEYNIEMCKQLISEIDESNALFVNA